MIRSILPETPTYKTLIIGDDAKQTDLYTDLVREVIASEVDVLTRLESSYEWIAKLRYQLVVIDHPRALGLLERIKQVNPQTSVIVVAGAATVENAVAAIRLGADDYLKKPINIDAFQLAVKRGLDRRTVFQEQGGFASYLNLLNACQMISASLEERGVFGSVKTFFLQELGSQLASVFWVDEQGGLRREEGAGPAETAMIELLEIAMRAADLPASMSGEDEFFRFIDRSALSPAIFVFRFSCGTANQAFCVCLAPKMPENMAEFEARLRILRAQIELTGHNILQYQGVRQMAYLDDATGLYNTRYLHYVLDRQIAHSRATGTSFAVLFVDADHFKKVNDSHGHLIGTRLLNELGRKLKEFVRETDTVFRYGGDEFVAVLYPCDLETGKVVAERIRRSVEKSEFFSAEGLKVKVTVSIGVALFPEHADSKKTIIDAADRAMYAAKNKSRNSVYVADLRKDAKPSGEASG